MFAKTVDVVLKALNKAITDEFGGFYLERDSQGNVFVMFDGYYVLELSNEGMRRVGCIGDNVSFALDEDGAIVDLTDADSLGRNLEYRE